MSSIKNTFLKGFEKTAALPKWLHEIPDTKAKIKGHSRVGLKKLLKRPGVLMGAIGG